MWIQIPIHIRSSATINTYFSNSNQYMQCYMVGVSRSELGMGGVVHNLDLLFLSTYYVFHWAGWTGWIGVINISVYVVMFIFVQNV